MTTAIKNEMPLSFLCIESSIAYYTKTIEGLDKSTPEGEKLLIHNTGCLRVWQGLKNDYNRIRLEQSIK